MSQSQGLFTLCLHYFPALNGMQELLVVAVSTTADRYCPLAVGFFRL